MNSRKRILIYSLLILACSVCCATGITMTILYQTSFEETRAYLVEIARGRAGFMAAVARFDAEHTRHGHSGETLDDAFQQIADAHQRHREFAETGEFVVARREGDQIIFLFPHRHGDGGDPDPVSWTSDLAEPMRRALSGQAGTLVGLDYRGASTLAAHVPVEMLNFGVVAKIDLAEVRAPFVKAGAVACGTTALLVLVGGWLILRVADPLIRRLGLFQKFAEESGHGLTMADLNRRFTYANPALCHMLGVDGPSDVLGKTFDPFYPEELRRRLGEEIIPAVLEEGHWKGELSQLSTKGEVFPTLENIFLIRDEKGKPLCLANVITDITDRKRADEALLESRERFKLLYEGAPIGYQSLDERGYFLEVNQVWLDLLGYDREEVIGRWFGDFLSPEFVEHFRRNFPCFKAQGEVHHFQFQMIRKDGSPILAEFDGKIDFDEYGEFERTHCVLHDITERKRAEEQLKVTLLELETFNRLVVGREERMIELKREVNEMARKGGIAPPYDSDLVEGSTTLAGQPIPQSRGEPSRA